MSVHGRRPIHGSWFRRVLISVAVVLAAGAVLFPAVPSAHAAAVRQVGGVQLLTSGPLAEIDVSTAGEIQAYDSRVCTSAAGCGEFYPYDTTGCGASVGVGVVYRGIAYGPDGDAPFSCNFEFDSWDVNLVPISQTASGNSVVTRLSLPGTGVTLTEVVMYSPGASNFRVLALLSAPGGKIYVGGEEDPGNNEDGYSYFNPADGAVAGFNSWTPGTHPTSCSSSQGGLAVIPSGMQYYVGETPLLRGSRWIIGGYRAPNTYASHLEDYPNANINGTGCQDLGFGLEFLNSAAFVSFSFGAQAP